MKNIEAFVGIVGLLLLEGYALYRGINGISLSIVTGAICTMITALLKTKRKK